MKLLKVLLTASAAIGISISSFAAINININSGNPVMPFPQFMDYVGGDTLASHLPDGVSHAEMEMWMRDAWKIHSNEFSYAGTITYQNAAGANVNVNLIKDSSSPYCSEGHGYALLAAALMCDKDAFDGLWFYLVENNYFNKSKIYSTNTIFNPGYNFGAWAPAWAGPGSDAATDGDDDIALACLIAWKQWGDNTGYYAPGGSGANNAAGRPAIQYKQMALDLMRFMVEKDEGDNVGDEYYDSGDIGFDGYVKGGNTWPEVTNWAISQPGDKPNRPGPQANSYYDYTAPGYYRCFAETLQANGDPAWNYNQFFRATAASNWVMGRLAASDNKVIDAGQYTVNGSNVTFQNFNVGGEDFRAPLRNILDYLWNGNPTEDWDPINHAIIPGGNNWQYQAAIKQTNFYRNPQATGLACKVYGSSKISFNGVAALTAYNLDGSEFWTFHLNRFGASAPAIVASQDFDLMGQFFRELMIEWDVATPGDNYLSSVPAYFHGFFRQVGLMILTGNWPNACDIMPTANMKVYKSMNKTYGFPGDTITYWINYRNYGSMDAANVYVRDTLPSAIEFVSSTPAPSSSDAANGVYEWGGFTVTGMRNQNYGATMGGITMVARVKADAAQGRYCNFADVRCSNGTGWTSSEFPNEVSTVLRRNCIDIVSAALTITKTANVSLVNVGDTITYTIDFCNSAAAAGWINGGRSGINWAAGVNPLQTNSSEYKLDFAAHHEAAEPVIDWSNYRISYFVNSALHGTQWGIAKNSSAPFDATISMTTEDFVACMPTACTDATGKSWNQRLMMTFNSMPSTPTHHLYNYYGMMSRIHMGTVTSPFYFEVRLFDSTYMNPQDWTDDWSQQTTAMNVSGPDQPMFPINPDWTKGDGTSVTWNKVNKHACETTPVSINNILIEEWDGYTWRRVFGNGPMPGREVTGVHVVDSLPAYLSFGGVVSAPAGATLAQSGKSLNWTIGDMQINQCGKIVYYAVVANPGCPVADTPQINKAFVYGDKEAPVSDDALVTIRCGVVPTFTATPTSTRTSTSTSTATSSPSQTATQTSTPTNTITPSSTATLTATTTATATASPTSTDTNMSTATPTSTSTLTSTPSSSSTATATPSVSPSSTFTRTPTFTITQTETVIVISATITLTWTASPTMTATPTATVTITSTDTATDTQTATNTFTHTATDSPTETYTYTYTATSTDTPTSTATNTYTASDTVTGTPPPTFTFTETFTNSNTMTYTDTATNTHTHTFTNTPTETFTFTQTSTFTDTFTATHTRTPSFTATHTNTFTNTFTHTATFTATFTATYTFTPGPTPVELSLDINVSGETPKVGSKITYQIVLRNTTSSDTWNVNIWDSLPAGTKFVSATAPSPYAYSVDGNVISWDFSGVTLNAKCYPGTPSCVDEITVEFTVEITQMPADKVFINNASAAYNDHAFPAFPKNEVQSDAKYFPGGMPVIYPNPFNPKKAKDGRLKIDNVPPGSIIQIYTIAGENVISIQAENIIAYWYGKNKYGNDVSPGLYFITIHNKANNKVQKAKLFVVGN